MYDDDCGFVRVAHDLCYGTDESIFAKYMFTNEKKKNMSRNFEIRVGKKIPVELKKKKMVEPRKRER